MPPHASELHRVSPQDRVTPSLEPCGNSVLGGLSLKGCTPGFGGLDSPPLPADPSFLHVPVPPVATQDQGQMVKSEKGQVGPAVACWEDAGLTEKAEGGGLEAQ